MKRSSVLGLAIAAATLFLSTAPSGFADDTKTISDGAAKGQATERTIAAPQGGQAATDKGSRHRHKAKTYNASHSNKADDAPAKSGAGAGKPGPNPSKNISDGAAKGQANE
jgi:hypothetical protein